MFHPLHQSHLLNRKTLISMAQFQLKAQVFLQTIWRMMILTILIHEGIPPVVSTLIYVVLLLLKCKVGKITLAHIGKGCSLSSMWLIPAASISRAFLGKHTYVLLIVEIKLPWRSFSDCHLLMFLMTD